MMAGARRVLVVQRRLTHYRVDFFERLRSELSRHDVELVLAHGEPTPAEVAKKDGAELSWAHRLDTRYLAGGRLCWQPFGTLMAACDAAVITPENKLLNNLGAQFLQRRCKVVFWGHGANLQAGRMTLAERYKRWLARHVDWWLAYTEWSRPLITRSGFPDARITVLNNAVDTLQLARQAAVAKQPERLAASRDRFGVKGRQVGIYVGSLYADKRPAMLLAAAQALRARVPDFELLVCGDGPDAPMVEAFCREHAWAHYAGVVKGQEKADALAVSRVLLSPGPVGLGVLDSFACALPLVTTDCGRHGPEIAYIENGVNGVLSDDSTQGFVDAAVTLLTDDKRRARLVERCAASAGEYTIERMAQNFARGVVSCLEAPRWR